MQPTKLRFNHFYQPSTQTLSPGRILVRFFGEAGRIKMPMLYSDAGSLRRGRRLCQAVIVSSDRRDLVFDIARLLSDHGLDLSHFHGQSNEGRFICGFSADATVEANLQLLLRACQQKVGGEIVAKIDGHRQQVHQSLLGRAKSLLLRKFRREADAGVIVWAKARGSLNAARAELRRGLGVAANQLLEFELGDPRPEVVAFFATQGPRRTGLLELTSKAAKGIAAEILLPTKMAVIRPTVRTAATVTYWSPDLQGCFEELVDPVARARAFVERVDAVRFKSQVGEGGGFRATFEVWVSGNVSKAELYRIFDPNLGLAIDYEVELGWRRTQAA